MFYAQFNTLLKLVDKWRWNVDVIENILVFKLLKRLVVGADLYKNSTFLLSAPFLFPSKFNDMIKCMTVNEIYAYLI